MAVLALPVNAPVKLVDVTLVKPTNVVELAPSAIAVVPTVILLFDNLALVIEPASIAFVTANAVIDNAVLLPVVPEPVTSPVNVNAPEIDEVVTPVTNPLAFTVITGTNVEEPNVPTLELTVARVVAIAPADVVISPVNAGIREAANAPELILVAFVVSVVADVAKPLIFEVLIPADGLILALVIVPLIISADETPNDN